MIYFQIKVDNLALTNHYVATWNVHGALEGAQGKLDHILYWDKTNNVGILCLQEIHARNLLSKQVLDPDLQSWTLCTAGPATGRAHGSTGFLIEGSYKVDTLRR